MFKSKKIWRYLIPNLLLMGLVVFDIQPVSAAYLTGGTGYWNNNGTSIYYNNGNIGIGTSSPASMLQINPTGSNEGIRIISSNYSPFVIRNTANDSDLVRINESGNMSVGGYLNISGARTSSGNIRFSTANPYITASSYIVIPGGIYVSGGTAYFSNQLQARGGIHNDNGAYLTIAGGTSSTTYFTGNVGIGTTNPTVKLEVVGNTDYAPVKISRASNDKQIGVSYYPAGTLSNSNKAWIMGLEENSNNFSFYNWNGSTVQDILYLTNSNNVGIGTTSPVAKLAVNGNIVSTVAPAAGTHVVNLDYLNSALGSVNASTLAREDNRQISPSELSAGRMKFGFTAYNNNNNSPYADFIHMRSYTDVSGGNDNLLVFNKTTGLGMRLYQQAFGSTTAYSTYKDVLLSDNSPTNNYVLKYTSNGTTVSAGKSQIIDNGTNVGIGVNPTYKLQVNGNAYFTGQVTVPAPTATSSAVNRAYVDTTFAPIGGSASLWASSSAGTYNNPVSGNVMIGTNTNADSYKLRVNGKVSFDSSNIVTDGVGNMVFDSFVDKSNAIYKIDPSATTTNSINVAGTINSVGGVLTTSGSGSNYMAGSLGLGVTPTQKLDINGDVLLRGGDLYGGVFGGVAGVWRFSTAYPNYGIFYSDLTNDRLDFSPNGGGTSTPVMSIVGNGNVGIGVGSAAPGALLQVGNNSASPAILIESNNAGTAGLEFGEASSARGSLWYTGDGYMHLGMNNRAREHMRFKYDATSTWMYGDIYFPGGGVWNSSGNIGIGISPASRLHVTGKTQITDGVAGADTQSYATFGVTREATSTAVAYIAMTRAGNVVKAMGIDGSNNWVFGGPTSGTQVITPQMTLSGTGLGVGVTPSYKLQVNGNAFFNGNVFVNTPSATGHAATKGYVDSVIAGGAQTSTSAYLLKTGGNMTGNIDMGGNNITSINKISVGTIDPLYDIKGIKYSTFAPAIVGGVKEEYVGQGQIKQCNSQSCFWYLDFDQTKEGSDEWVWRQTIDFRPEKVEVLMTAQGLPMPLSYEFKDNGIMFHSEKPTKFSYRLIGARFDWREWPTKALDQTEKASLTIK